jgi:hypothetical protein
MAGPRAGGMAGTATRMAGAAAIPKENKNGENNETEINTNINRTIVDPNDNDQFSGTNIVEGIKNFYNLVDQSGLLTENKVNETKENLLNIAEENKNNESESNGDPKFLSYSLEGVNPLQNIFNYNPEANIGFDIGNKDGGFFATGDVDASLSGLDTNLQAGFKNENFNIGYNPEGGFNYGFNRQFGDNTNLGINQSGVQLGTQFGDNTDINLAYNNGNFNPSLNTKLLNTDIALNPNRLDLNRTFEIGDNTNVNVGGEVDFDGETKGDIEFTRDFLNKKLQLYGGLDTQGGYEAGAKFNFLNL